jgi:hypothetical protein
VHVVEHKHERIVLGGLLEQRRRRLEQPEAGVLGLEQSRTPRLRRKPRELGDELSDESGVRTQPRAQRCGIDTAHKAPDRLHPGPIGRRAARLPATTDEHDAAPLAGACRQLLAQPRLPDTRLARHQEQASTPRRGVGEACQKPAELALATDEHPTPITSRLAALQRRILTEDLLLELSQRGTRLEPKLIAQRAPRIAVGRQRLSLTARAVERQHQLGPQPLAQRMKHHKRLELADQLRITRENQVRLDPPLERVKPLLLEPHDLGGGELLIREIGERGAAPEGERLTQRASRLPWLTSRGPGGQALETVRVHLVRSRVQHVAGRPALERALAERGAEPGEIDLDGLDRRRWLRRAPELGDDALGWKDLVAV